MSETYKPSQEEIEKAEEMAVEGEMTSAQEKMSKVRADDFEAGYEAGYGAGVKSDEQKKIKQREKKRELDMAVAREEKESKIKDRIDEICGQFKKGYKVDFEEWDTENKGNPRYAQGRYFEDVQRVISVNKLSDRIIVGFANGEEVTIDPRKEVTLNIYHDCPEHGYTEWSSTRQYEAIN